MIRQSVNTKHTSAIHVELQGTWQKVVEITRVKVLSNIDQFTQEETEMSNDDTQPDHLGMFAIRGNSPPIKVKLG